MLQLNISQKLLTNFCSLCHKFSRSLVNQAHTMSVNKVVEEVDVNQSEKRSHEDEVVEDVKKLKTDNDNSTETAPTIKIKKRNYAMMLGYLGKNYFGMQRNPKIPTIEEDLIKAMLQAELINNYDYETIQNIHFQRAARTDKGVSAIRQVVSCKLPETVCKEEINKHLCEDIRVFAIKRVTKGFNSKSQCDARTYSYTIPTFAFAPENLELFPKPGDWIDLDKRKEQLSVIDDKPYSEYRIPADDVQKLNELLKLYEGTHNFHNFTSRTLPLDPRAKRYIMSFTTEEPFIVDNSEYITLKVKGQSFMLHQIRKMVGMIVGVMRNIVPKESLELAFGVQKYDISIAPSLGLMLNIVHYDYYNKRYSETAGTHEKLDWVECEKEVLDFAKNKILKHVFDTETNEKTTLAWLSNFDSYSFGLHENRPEDYDDQKKELINKETF